MDLVAVTYISLLISIDFVISRIINSFWRSCCLGERVEIVSGLDTSQSLSCDFPFDIAPLDVQHMYLFMIQICLCDYFAPAFRDLIPNFINCLRICHSIHRPKIRRVVPLFACLLPTAYTLIKNKSFSIWCLIKF